MRFDVLTLFPEMFSVVSELGVTGKAHQLGRWQLHTWNPRSFSSDHHQSVDDRPYGGGPGMVMLIEPLQRALAAAQAAQQEAAQQIRGPQAPVILLSPQGKVFKHAQACDLGKLNAVTLICGRYEAIDQRFIDQYVDLELSLGDFVLSGGEIAAMAVIDSTVRLLPGVLGHEQSAEQDSFSQGLLDCPHYTRPKEYQGQLVPDVLLSGNHLEISRWRRKQALATTYLKRPDLIDQAIKKDALSKEDLMCLKHIDKG